MSRARRVVENAFGTMASRFRILQCPILLNALNATKVVKAIVTLHNYIIENCNTGKTYLDPNKLQREDKEGSITPGSWELECRDNGQFIRLGRLAGNRTGSDLAKVQRDTLAKMMVADNHCPWQFQYTFRTG